MLPYLIKKKVAFSNVSPLVHHQDPRFETIVNLVAIGSQLFGFAVLMLFDFLKSFQNAPFCTITCKDFDKISGKTRFQACLLENSLNRRKGKISF